MTIDEWQGLVGALALLAIALLIGLLNWRGVALVYRDECKYLRRRLRDEEDHNDRLFKLALRAADGPTEDAVFSAQQPTEKADL